MNFTPTRPVAVVELVITGDGGRGGIIENTIGAVPLPLEFTTLRVATDSTGNVGVPEINPVEFIENPAGKPVAEKVGLLVAVIWRVKGIPT